MIAVAAFWRRFGDWNFINRRIAEISLATLAVSAANRASGHLLGTSPEHVLISDAFILGLGGTIMSAYHRGGPWLAGMSLGVAALGSLYPAWVDELFIALTVFVASTMLLLRWAGLVSPAGSDRTSQP
jgi:hypothetical protein